MYEALWQLVEQQQRAGLSSKREVHKMARKKLVELLRFADSDVKIFYINKCVDHVSDPTIISMQVLKTLYKTVSWLPRYTAHMSNQVSQKSFVTEMVTQYQIIDVLLSDLESYKQKA